MCIQKYTNIYIIIYTLNNKLIPHEFEDKFEIELFLVLVGP